MDNNPPISDQTNMDSNLPPVPPPVKEPSKVWKHLSKHWLVYLLLLLLLTSNIYSWIANRVAQNKHQKEVITVKENYLERAKAKILENSKLQLTLMVKTLVWAVRSAAIRKNNDEIDQYFNELVQNESIREVFYVGKEGVVLVATNKKHEKMEFSKLYAAEFLTHDEIKFFAEGESYYLVGPILSLNQRIGTLFLVVSNNLAEINAEQFEKGKMDSIPVMKKDSSK